MLGVSHGAKCGRVTAYHVNGGPTSDSGSVCYIPPNRQPQVLSNNEISANESQILDIKRDQGQLQVAFCSQPPGSGDWIPRPTLELDGRILMASGGTRLAEDGCWQVVFDTEGEPGKESKAVFHLNRWVLSLEEGQALKLTSDPEMLLKACQQAREDLKARGFAFTCQPDAGKSFGLDTQVSRQPDSYSAADTRMVILESVTGEVVWSDWQAAIRIP